MHCGAHWRHQAMNRGGALRLDDDPRYSGTLHVCSTPEDMPI